VYIDYLRRRYVFGAMRWHHTVDRFESIPSSASVLLVSVPHELAQTQMYPFYFYKDILRKKHGLNFAEISLDTVIKIADQTIHIFKVGHIKRIFFQPNLDMPPAEEERALLVLKHAFPNAEIALMDWFAPLHVRPATAANQYIDLYVKKQLYREFSHFAIKTIGDTNLNDYYAKRHRLPDEPMQFVIPAGLESKLRLGSNFGLSPQMVDLFLGPMPRADGRDIDLHSRIAVKGVDWYRVMREEAKAAVGKLKGLKIVSDGRVLRPKFFQELRRSKICFSPFGYGEVCWRDYEAFATGAILMKPSMDHLRVTPDVFVSGKTYLPLSWDLNDFEDKVYQTLADFPKTRAMREEAFMVMNRWITSAVAADDIAALC
jgi:hypothetical protein